MDHSKEAERVCSDILFGSVELGSSEYEKMIDFMRADLESDMGYSKIIAAGRKIVEDRGGNFEDEFEKWKEKIKQI